MTFNDIKFNINNWEMLNVLRSLMLHIILIMQDVLTHPDSSLDFQSETRFLLVILLLQVKRDLE